ncbi:excinuclease ABC subunit UvrC [Candidatus Bathyarchaeota archaeon]|nr:excinuclease ABC subunit UvrC [Candidatus Bathyarchaeota archaeon]
MIQISDPSEFKSSELPTDPGVYLFRDQKSKIMYIGKANNLRSRVRSYFSDADQPIKTRQLVSRIRSIDWIVVNNETEALLLENRLVKNHSPKYNISLKDAKTFAYIALTRETFPRLLTTRKISRKLESFGPYTEGFTRRDLQKQVVKVFKLRVCKKLPKRACLNFHIDLCTAPCTGNVSAEQYQKQVEEARVFLNGDYEQTLERLSSQINDASRRQNYEYALELQKQIASIKLLTQKQIVDHERGFDQDVMVFRRFGEKMLVVQMSIRKGVLLGKKEFSVEVQPQIEQEFLKTYYSENQIPHEILLNKRCWSDKAEKTALECFLSSKRGALVKFTIPRRSDKRALVELAEKNIEASLADSNVLSDLQAALGLPVLPRIIECFDISNLGQEHVVAGMVRFVDGKTDKSNYRRFKIKNVVGQDDFAAMHEVVTRRYKRLLDEKLLMPDLVVVDGGAGQVGAANLALKSLGIQLSLIGLAKEYEEIYLPEEKAPIQFDTNRRMMFLLRQIRDAAHTFAVRYNRKRRQMKMRGEFKTK